MRHPSQELMLGYAAGTLDPAQAEQLVSHLDACAACESRYQALVELRDDFEGSWQQFLDEFHARNPVRPEPVAAATDLRMLLDSARNLASAAWDRLTGSPLEVAFVPSFSGTGDPRGKGEASRLALEASQMLEHGDTETARSRLSEAAARDPLAGGRAQLELRSGGTVVGSVIVQAADSRVSVLLYSDRIDCEHAWVAMAAAGKKLRVEFAPVPGAPYRLAELQGVPDGEFRIRIVLS